MGAKVGDRVGAASHGNKEAIYLFGYGVYEGDFIPEEAGGFLAEAGREAGVTNPRIRLDNGKAIYGCECWWGSEQKVKEIEAATTKAGGKVIILDIDEERKKCREEEAKKDGR